MKWSALVPKLTYTHLIQPTDVTITSVETDSRKVHEGSIFVCLQGEHTNGHHYIEQAVDKGAVVIVTEEDVPPIPNVVMLYTRSTTRSLAEISCAFYDFPSHDLNIVGITGTNGKTSITQFLNQLYRQKGKKTGVIGTIHTDINGVITPSENTTPFAHDLQHTLYKMRKENISTVFMEVSSHALAMGRVRGCDFQQAVFTNLSQDHLDYHETMEEYKQAKGLLFSQLGNKFDKTAVLNADDTTFEYLLAITGGKVISYGIDQPADIQASAIDTQHGLSFTLTYQQKTYRVETSLVGRFNVYNLLAVFGVCLAEGWHMEEIIAGIRQLSPVKGRMETVQTELDATIVIDYAHTPDALENALQSLTKKEGTKLYTVIGCGGNRDKTKRPLMARVAETYSDYVFLTSDNPRFEDPCIILHDMERGMTGRDFNVYVNREEAIIEAVKQLQAGDILLIAGKGHEEYQIIGDEKISFSDTLVVKEAVKKTKTVATKH